jgi:hypothetical protein
VTPTANVQFLIPCCWVIGVDMNGRLFACLGGAVEETKTVAGLDVAEEACGSQVCVPEEEPGADGVDVGGWEARC